MSTTKTSAAQLLPCPFCGAPAEYDSQRWNGVSPATDPANTGHAIYCTNCPLPAAGGCLQFETREEAFEHWNQRAGTVASESGCTPRQLLAQRDELLAALEKCAKDIEFWSARLETEWPNFDGQLNPALNQARTAIRSVKPDL